MSTRAYALRLLNLRPHPAPTVQVIRAAFRKAALIHHPDLPNGCKHRFLEIQSAHDELLRGPSTTSPNYSQRHHWGAREAETAAEAADRREYEEILRQARLRREEDLREDTEEEAERKWSYLRLVAGIVCVGTLIKLAIFQAVALWRQVEIEKAMQQQRALRRADDKENSNDGAEELFTIRAAVTGRAQPR